MTPEYWFNSQVGCNPLQENQMVVTTGRNVRGSRRYVTAVTASSEIRPYASRTVEIALATGRIPW